MQHNAPVEFTDFPVKQGFLVTAGGHQAAGMLLGQIRHEFRQQLEPYQKCLQRVFRQVTATIEDIIQYHIFPFQVTQ